MAKRQTTTSGERKRVPKVRIARPKERPFQLRYARPNDGREVRISVGSRDERVAQQMKAEIEAKLLLGIESKPTRKPRGPQMPWTEFREEYERLKSFRSEKARYAAVVRLDVAERIMAPRRLTDMIDPAALSELQARLLVGEGNKTKSRSRSQHSVKSYMRTVIAALNWAHEIGWLEQPIRFKVLAVDHEAGKGRPITTEEFERMLSCCAGVCPVDPASWQFLLYGIWESGMRMEEAMAATWDGKDTIRPHFPLRGRPVLVFPAPSHKKRRETQLPMLPGFVRLLKNVPEDQQHGWLFRPHRRRRNGDGDNRLTASQTGRIIAQIGAKAGVVVNDAGKTATAQDLRCSFGQRLADAGVAPRDLQLLMRHASITTTERYYLTSRVQEVGDRIAGKLDSIPPEDVKVYLGTHSGSEQ